MFKAIPRVWVDLKTNEIISILFQMLNTKNATNNDEVPAFEEAYAGYIGTKEAVAFPRCRTALYFALKALDLNEGDEVILPAFTFFVDAAMVVLAGLRPVFVDVEFNTANIDASQIEKVIMLKTKVILPTHLNGLPVDMDPIMEIAKKYNLRVLEDCARSCGAKYKNRRVGSFDIGAFSFGYGKTFYGFGGAMVTSNDEPFIERLRGLKKEFCRITVKNLYVQTLKGLILKYLNIPHLYRFSLFPMVYKLEVEGDQRYASMFRVKMPPYNNVPEDFMVDMNNIQARLGLKQLERIDMTNKKRIANARILNEELSGIPGLRIPPFLPDREYVSVHYAIWTERKKDLQIFLFKNNVDVQDDTASDTTQMDRFKQYVRGDFPNAAKLHHKTIFLPTHPYLTSNDMLYIAKKVKEFFEHKS